MDLTFVEIIIFLILGIIATSYGVLVGAGGGFIIGPVLILLFGWSTKMAVGTSLVCVSLASISGAISYLRLRIVDIRSALLFGIAAMPGAILAVIGLEKIESSIFYLLFSSLLFLTGIYIFWSPLKSEQKEVKHTKYQGENPQKFKVYWRVYRNINPKTGEKYFFNFIEPLAILLNTTFGFISSFFGIGGGPLRTPSLVYFFNFPIKVATATSVATMSIYTIFGSITHGISGNVDIIKVLPLGVGAIIGSQIGVILSKKLKGKLLLRLLSIAMIVIAVQLGIEGLIQL